MTRPLTEAQWQDQVTELASLHGWGWLHAERVVTRRRNRDGSERMVNETPLRGPLGRGWPDLVLVRERIIFAELKASGGAVRPEQTVRLEQLAATGAETYVWRPRDWDQVVAVLSRRDAAMTNPTKGD